MNGVGRRSSSHVKSGSIPSRCGSAEEATGACASVDQLDTRTASRAQRGDFLLDARLDGALAKPSRLRERARPPPEPRRRACRATSRDAGRASRAASLTEQVAGGQAGRDVLAGWTATRERSMRQDGTLQWRLVPVPRSRRRGFYFIVGGSGRRERLSKSTPSPRRRRRGPRNIDY